MLNPVIDWLIDWLTIFLKICIKFNPNFLSNLWFNFTEPLFYSFESPSTLLPRHFCVFEYSGCSFVHLIACCSPMFETPAQMVQVFPSSDTFNRVISDPRNCHEDFVSWPSFLVDTKKVKPRICRFLIFPDLWTGTMIWCNSGRSGTRTALIFPWFMKYPCRSVDVRNIIDVRISSNASFCIILQS